MCKVCAPLYRASGEGFPTSNLETLPGTDPEHA